MARTFSVAEVRENDGRRTLEDMLERIGSREVLHVASHTRGTPAAPWRAGFLLGRGEGEAARDPRDAVGALGDGANFFTFPRPTVDHAQGRGGKVKKLAAR